MSKYSSFRVRQRTSKRSVCAYGDMRLGSGISSRGSSPTLHRLYVRGSLATFKQAAGDNRLLAALPRRTQRHLLASCDKVELGFADVLYRAGARIGYVYFPTDSILLLVTALDDGSRLEAGIVGREGMLGTSLVLGLNASPQHAMVQSAGASWRMSATNFQRHFRENVQLRQLLNSYVHVLMSQLAQTAACTHYHLVQERLARLLLMTRDRAQGCQFHLTHQFLAYMLGVRRVGVTNAATSLQEQGLIDYRRGAITILDNAGLERMSCACYRGGNDIYERTLGTSRAARCLQ
jgi:CRP-like cAMP-binding protein